MHQAPLRFYRTFFDNASRILLKTKVGRGPLFVSWDMSYRCNSRCTMCDRWKRETQEELCLRERIEILKDLAASGVCLVSICGGEPFLQEGFEEILNTAKENKLIVSVTTNGSLIGQNLDLMKYIDNLIISLDSHIGELHDAIRGFPGLFNRALDGINAIAGLDRKPALSVRCVLSKRNIAHVEDYVSFFKGKVSKILFQPIHRSPNSGFSIPEYLSECSQGEAEILKKFCNTLNKTRLSNIYNKGIVDFLFHQDEVKNISDCLAGYFSAEIDNLGTLWNCAGHTFEFGNLREKKMLEILAVSENRFRDQGRKLKCACYYNCAMINICLSKIAGRGNKR